jgi:hypothetical protein
MGAIDVGETAAPPEHHRTVGRAYYGLRCRGIRTYEANTYQRALLNTYVHDL